MSITLIVHGLSLKQLLFYFNSVLSEKNMININSRTHRLLGHLCTACQTFYTQLALNRNRKYQKFIRIAVSSIARHLIPMGPVKLISFDVGEFPELSFLTLLYDDFLFLNVLTVLTFDPQYDPQGFVFRTLSLSHSTSG
jgi:hypothetical protein